ncbi:MAG: transcriptional regulator NrdR [Planctomycetota bacterium]|nr:transcriptional regulator NrdR [Planctomycetota bacterium]
MRCPFCKNDDDKVIDSRSAGGGLAIRRRRECNRCGRRFTTYERVEKSPLKVVKKNGRREPFEHKKLASGIEKACHKLPIPTEKIKEAIDTVERAILDEYEVEVDARVIGEKVMDVLKRLNHVAYIRFASVYREFRDAADFVREARKVAETGGGGVVRKEESR